MNIEKVLEVFAKSVEPVVLSEHFIVWAGDNLVEVCRFTGLHKKFMDWFPSWGDYAKYVQEHNNIFKVFTEDGHYEVPVGSWLVKAPDGLVYPCGEGVRFISNAQNIKEKIERTCLDKEYEIPIEKEGLITTYYPEDIYETEVVENGNGISLRHKLDENGKPILKKDYGGLNKFAASRWKNAKPQIKVDNRPIKNWESGFKKELDKWK